MSAESEKTNIPAALPNLRGSDERETFRVGAAVEGERLAEDGLDDEHDEPDYEPGELAGSSRRNVLAAVVCFLTLSLFLLVSLSWFFGFGPFAETKTETVDRTDKSSETHLTEGEKLRTALDLVADQAAPGDTAQPELGDNGADSELGTDLINVPEENWRPEPDSAVPDSQTENGSFPRKRPAGLGVGNPAETPDGREATTPTNASRPVARKSGGDMSPTGRSLFFGEERGRSVVTPVVYRKAGEESGSGEVDEVPPEIPFGTLFPIRFAGAVHSFRGANPLVRMELGRPVAGGNYSFPAGTLLVGTVRGSEHDRVFISLKGLVDPQTGGLLEIEGDVVERDGSSGVVGRKRKVRGGWSRFLKGLREAGSVAVGALGGRGSGGTVIISDSGAKASRVLAEEVSELIARENPSNEFVEIGKGTEAFVLVTNLPKSRPSTGQITGATRP